MPRRARLWLLRIALFLASTVGVIAVAVLARDAILSTQARNEVQELSRLLLTRVERSIDYAVIAAAELVEDGVENCDPNVVERIRAIVLASGPVKDIHLLSREGRSVCSSQSLSTGVQPGASLFAGGAPARNSSYLLHVVKGPRSTLLAIVWHSGAAPDIAVLIDLDMLMFDLFPGWLRDQASAELILGGGDVIAQRLAEAPLSERNAAKRVFSSASSRFPLLTRIVAPEAEFASRHGPPDPLFLATTLLLGLLLASVAIRAFASSPSALSEFDDALKRGEIQPFFQPLASLDTGALTGFEVLARWLKPGGTIISPARFIPMAEENGRSASLTLSLAGQALDQMRDLLEERPEFKIAINVVPDDFVATGFLERFHALVIERRVSPNQIVLELTERRQIDDINAARRVVMLAQQMGFRVAIDDAGAGHNGLSNIQALGAHILKIDKVFVDLIGKDDAANAIIEMLARLGRRLSMVVVAEGVESAGQTTQLKALGVHEAQGYFIARPMPGPQAQQFVGRWLSGRSA